MNDQQERFDKLIDEYLDVPIEELADRMVHLLNKLAGFPPGKGWIAPNNTPSPFEIDNE